MFGHQIHYVIKVLSARRHPPGQQDDPDEAARRVSLACQLWHVIMQCLVSLIILTAGFCLIFFSDDEAQRRPVFGLIGVVVGYWLR